MSPLKEVQREFLREAGIPLATATEIVWQRGAAGGFVAVGEIAPQPQSCAWCASPLPDNTITCAQCGAPRRQRA